MMGLLFDTPWWLPVAIALGGVAAFVMGNSRRNSAVRNAGAGAVLLAITLALVSYLVDTPVEKAEKDSRRLVQAFVQEDWTTFGNLLDRKVSLAAQGIPLAIYSNREELLRNVQAAQAQYRFTAIRVISARGKQVDTVIPVIISVLSEQDATMGRPFPSTWEFEWQDFGDGYKISRITAIKIANESPVKFSGNFPRN